MKSNVIVVVGVFWRAVFACGGVEASRRVVINRCSFDGGTLKMPRCCGVIGPHRDHNLLIWDGRYATGCLGDVMSTFLSNITTCKGCSIAINKYQEFLISYITREINV